MKWIISIYRKIDGMLQKDAETSCTNEEVAKKLDELDKLEKKGGRNDSVFRLSLGRRKTDWNKN